MVRTRTEPDDEIVMSSGNVFADLGFADAEEREIRVLLARAIIELLQRLRLPQSETAGRLGISEPMVSALLNYKLGRFSFERLIHFLIALDQGVEITIRAKPRSRRAGRIVVKAA